MSGLKPSPGDAAPPSEAQVDAGWDDEAESEEAEESAHTAETLMPQPLEEDAEPEIPEDAAEREDRITLPEADPLRYDVDGADGPPELDASEEESEGRATLFDANPLRFDPDGS